MKWIVIWLLLALAVLVVLEVWNRNKKDPAIVIKGNNFTDQNLTVELGPSGDLDILKLGEFATYTTWYNFKTQEWEWLSNEMPMDYRDYIPQIPAGLALYEIYIEQGSPPRDAAVKVLLLTVDEMRKESDVAHDTKHDPMQPVEKE